jgi:hypothetical protein
LCGGRVGQHVFVFGLPYATEHDILVVRENVGELAAIAVGIAVALQVPVEAHEATPGLQRVADA